MIDDRRVLLLTQRFQAHPQLQRVKTTGGLQRFGHQVRHTRFFVELRVQVGRLIAHQLVVTRFFQQERAAADGLEELLVEVQGDGIHQLDAVQVVTILLRHQQRAAPGRINVYPDVLLSGQLCNRTQRVNSTGIGCTCRCDDRQNLLAVRVALLNFRRQIGQIHAGKFVRFHLHHGLVAQTHQRHVFLHGEVCVFGAQHANFAQISHQTVLLNGVTLTREERIASQHQAHQVALGTAAGEDTCVAGLITHAGTQPLDQLDLNNGCGRALIPGVHTLVSGVDQHFRRLAYHQAWAVQVRHTLRVMNGQAVFQEELHGAFNRRFVAQPFRVEIQLNTVAQFCDRFALVHLRLFQPLHHSLSALFDRLLISFNALRRGEQNWV